MCKRQTDILTCVCGSLPSASPVLLFHCPIAHLCAKIELWIPQTTEIGVLKFWSLWWLCESPHDSIAHQLSGMSLSSLELGLLQECAQHKIILLAPVKAHELLLSTHPSITFITLRASKTSLLAALPLARAEGPACARSQSAPQLAGPTLRRGSAQCAAEPTRRHRRRGARSPAHAGPPTPRGSRGRLAGLGGGELAAGAHLQVASGVTS